MACHNAAASHQFGAAIPREQIGNVLRDREPVIARRADQRALDNLVVIRKVHSEFERDLRRWANQDIDQAFLH